MLSIYLAEDWGVLIKQTQSCPVACMHLMPFGILNVLALELHMHC